MSVEPFEDPQVNEVEHPILYSSLAFGAGMALGFLLIYFLLISPILSWVVDLIDAQQPFIKILIGLFLFLGTIGLGGAVAGAWGGLALSRFSRATSEQRFLRRGALSFFIAHTVLALPTIVVLAAVAFLNPNIDVSYSKLPLVMGLIGLLYGIIAGLLLDCKRPDYGALFGSFWLRLPGSGSAACCWALSYELSQHGMQASGGFWV